VLAPLWIGASGLVLVLAMAGLMLGLAPGSALILALMLASGSVGMLTRGKR
jgi:hypothetical protein